MSATGAYRRGLAQIARVAAGKIAGLVSLLATSVLVARATGPDGFGLYSAGLAIVLLFDAIVGQPIDSSLIRFSSLHRDTPESVVRIQVLVFRTKLALGGSVLLAVYFSDRFLSNQLFGPGAPQQLTLVVAMCGVALLATRSLACAFQIREEFGAYASLDLVQGLLRLGLVVSLFISGAGSPVRYLLVHAIGGLVAFTIFQLLHRQRLFVASWPGLNDARRMLSYTGATSAIVLLGTISGRADIPVLAATTSPEVTGHYSAAMQIAFLGMLLASYVTVVTQPKVVELGRRGRLKELLKLNAFGAAAAAILYAPVAFGLLPFMLPWMFGPDFAPSVPIVQILLIGIIADLLTVPILMPYAFQMLARQTLIGEAVILVLFVAGVLAIPELGAIGMAWLVTAVRFAKLAVYLTVVSRRLAIAP